MPYSNACLRYNIEDGTILILLSILPHYSTEDGIILVFLSIFLLFLYKNEEPNSEISVGSTEGVIQSIKWED